MLSLQKLGRADHEKKQAKKIEKELPYFITIVTLLATSGLGPYSILQKIKDLNLLPAIRHESIKIIKRIDMLGLDPLTVLSQAKEKTSSRLLGDFLAGYVSAIQSGGNVISYLKSKMSSSFEMLEAKEKRINREDKWNCACLSNHADSNIGSIHSSGSCGFKPIIHNSWS